MLRNHYYHLVIQTITDFEQILSWSCECRVNAPVASLQWCTTAVKCIFAKICMQTQHGGAHHPSESANSSASWQSCTMAGLADCVGVGPFRNLAGVCQACACCMASRPGDARTSTSSLGHVGRPSDWAEARRDPRMLPASVRAHRRGCKERLLLGRAPLRSRRAQPGRVGACASAVDARLRSRSGRLSKLWTLVARAADRRGVSHCCVVRCARAVDYSATRRRSWIARRAVRHHARRGNLSCAAGSVRLSTRQRLQVLVQLEEMWMLGVLRIRHHPGRPLQVLLG